MERIWKEVENLKDEMVDALSELIKIPAISPDSGGTGEIKKAERLLQIIDGWGFDRIERYDAPDDRAEGGVRPNILCYYYGSDGDSAQRIVILTHMDVVPPGDVDKWTVTKPFEPRVVDGKLYGRGSEDNGQGLITSLYGVKALMNLGIRGKRTVVLAFVSDEETGNKYGLDYLLKEHPLLFRKDDIVVVPDGGEPDGMFIEIAEKNILEFRVKTLGKQVHAMSPASGVNAHLVGMLYAVTLHKMLYDKYRDRDALFEPPYSTFEPTKKEKNVDAVNIIPGEDVLYFDCRILPTHDVDMVLREATELAATFEEEYGAKIDIEVTGRIDSAPPTRIDSDVVRLLTDAVKLLRGKEPRVGGIGGGTFANAFRAMGIPAAVWGTMDEMAHKTDEYTRIENLVEDAKVFATLAVL